VLRTPRFNRGLLPILAILVTSCGGSGSQTSQSASDSSPASSATPAPASSAPAAVVPVPTLTPEQRAAGEAFYKGKTLSIYVGSGAGGGFDTTARLVSRHLARHIPGNPTIIVVNMPGGGGMIAANYLYNSAPKDGTAVGIFHEAQMMNQLTRVEGVQFDLRKFNWLGSSYVDPNVCLVRNDAPVSTFKDAIGRAQPVPVGGTGPGSNTYDAPRVLAAATGANLKAVAGYPTTNDARVGVERGELQGMCLGWESVKSASKQWLDDKYAHVIVQNGLAKHRELPDVPLAAEFAKDDTARAMLKLVDAPAAMSKPFVLPPGVDATLVAVMRFALLSTFADPKFQEEAATMNLEFQPKDAAGIQQVLDEVLATPQPIADKYRAIIAP
jgi:tripartite-type tricarboxylate transporter receptor subunit TctC